MGNRIGYARSAVADSGLSEAIEKLKASGCADIYHDNGASGVSAVRPGLQSAINAVRDGNTLVVCSIAALSRSLPDLANILSALNERNIAVETLDHAAPAKL